MIKQHLRIKSFYGASENAVKTQIWIAVSIYVLVAIVRKRLGLEISLYQILPVLSVTLFEKTPILQALQPPDPQTGFTQLRPALSRAPASANLSTVKAWNSRRFILAIRISHCVARFRWRHEYRLVRSP
jgi:hypothetical protein